MRKIKLHKEKDFKPISPEESRKYMDFNKVVGYKDLYQYQQIKKPLYKKPMFLGFIVVIAVVLLVSIWEEEHPKNSNKRDELPVTVDSISNDSVQPKDTISQISPTTQNTATIRPIRASNHMENNSTTDQIYPDEGPISVSECSYPGGQSALEKFIKNGTKYPYNAIDHPLNEYVQVDLIIDSTGKATIQKIARTNPAFIVEINKLVSQMPKWNPKKINQQAVRSEYSITVPFIYNAVD